MKKTKDEVKTKKSKKVKKEKKYTKEWLKSAIMSFGLVLLMISMTYSSVVIWQGTKGKAPLIMVAPQALFVAALLLKGAFTAIRNYDN